MGKGKEETESRFPGDASHKGDGRERNSRLCAPTLSGCYTTVCEGLGRMQG